MPIEFTEDERAALIDLLVGTIEHDLFPQSLRIQRLRDILAKLRAARLVDAEGPIPDLRVTGFSGLLCRLDRIENGRLLV